MSICSIYVIKCKRNNKVYVGQTWNTIERRFKDHLKGARNKNNNKLPKLYNAIRYHGEIAFSIEKIDEADTQLQADILEDFYILAANSIKNGYNVKRGGSKGKHAASSKKKVGDAKRGIPRSKEVMQRVSETKIREGIHKGEKHGMAILNEEKVLKIRALVAEGKISKIDIGRMFNVTPNVIYRVHTGQTWKHVGGKITPAIYKCGGTCNNAKLTKRSVLEIRRKYAKGTPEFQLAKDYKVSHGTIGNVVKRKTWKNI
jgi:group I intron endonuclease